MSGPVNARDARGNVYTCGAANTCNACNAPASGVVHARADTSTGQPLMRPGGQKAQPASGPQPTDWGPLPIQ